MFTVVFRYGTEPAKECICDMFSLFYICSIFERDSSIVNFKVTQQGSTIFPSHFGWGTFSKWVEKLYPTE